MRRLSLIALTLSTILEPAASLPVSAPEPDDKLKLQIKRDIACSCPSPSNNPANNAGDWYCGDSRLGTYHIPDSLPRAIFTEYYRFGNVAPTDFFTKFYNDQTQTWIGGVNPMFQAHASGASFNAVPTLITPDGAYQHIDGFGADGATYAFLNGTPYAHRSVAPSRVVPDNYQHFTVMKAFWASVGRVPPWFGQPGGGLGFFLQDGSTWGDLVRNGTVANTTDVQNGGMSSPNVC